MIDKLIIFTQLEYHTKTILRRKLHVFGFLLFWFWFLAQQMVIFQWWLRVLLSFSVAPSTVLNSLEHTPPSGDAKVTEGTN